MCDSVAVVVPMAVAVATRAAVAEAVPKAMVEAPRGVVVKTRIETVACVNKKSAAVHFS